MTDDPAKDCIHCGFCLESCPTYLLWDEEMDSPRGRIELISATQDGIATLNATVVQHIDRCLGCLACVTACPSGVRYDVLIEEARVNVEEGFKRPFLDRLIRSLLFVALPYPRRLAVLLPLGRVARHVPLPGALRPLLAVIPPWSSRVHLPEVVPACVQPARGRVALLTGCVQSVVFGSVNAATARVLAAEGYEVVVPRGQGCCGALSLHAGRRDEAVRLAKRLVAVLERCDADAIVVNSAGCGSHLKHVRALFENDEAWAARAAALEGKVRDAGEFLASVEPVAERHPLSLRVALQDACHVRHGQQIQTAFLSVLRTIPDLEVIQPAEQDICCGSAGIYNVVQADAAQELGRRKAEHILETHADVFASANPGCLVQVAGTLRGLGRPLPALHPIELVAAAIDGADPAQLVADARR
jgi:glycolate oxidase iron-sulfur subunit